jgi:UDP-3-O-[3-hydroxymyristoyl] glucosamine N-acyltransferase
MSSNLGEIAQVIDAELVGDPLCRVSGVATLKNASSDELTFLANPRYTKYLKTTTAAAVVLSAEAAADCPVNCLISNNPYLAYVKAVRYLNPEATFEPGIHASAVIDVTATIHESSFIGANSFVGKNVIIGERVYIGPGCVIEDNVSIGMSTRLVANVTICHGVVIGQRGLIHPGVVIGSDGFGIANDSGTWLKIPQIGSVTILDDVEIGANSAIDRGALENTLIEEGVKIDNLVQIGHNAVIGAHTAIAGCAAIAGSTTVGKRCMIGGMSAVTGHISIANDVIITGLSGVTNSIKNAGMYSGAMTITDNMTWRKNMVRFRHLNEMARRLGELEEQILKIKKRSE